MAPIPHPLAGKAGEGPPIAPPNWKWRAGNRISDMYFYSPSGKQFRSRPELANYLQTLNNPPDANLFCWRVTDEVLKNGYVPREDVVIPKPAKRKTQNSSGGNKRVKTSIGKPIERPPVSFVKASDFTMQPTKVGPIPLVAPGLGPNLQQRGTTFSSPTSIGHQYLSGRDRPKGKRVRVSVPHSFKSILAGRSSFKWLYDSDTLEKFLEEARRLKHKSAVEINEIRNVLLERHLDANNICKYPNSVIRVFARLLRNEEAPASMGKIELAHLCVNWKCKKRHYWCMLEVGRMNSSRKFTKVDDVKRGGGLSPGKGSVNHKVRLGWKSEYSDTYGAVTGCANGFREQLGRNPIPDVRLPDGSGNVAVNDDTHAPYTPIGLDSVGCTLHGEDLSGSEKPFLRQAERTTAVCHGNDKIHFHGSKDETVRTSEPFSPNVVHRDPSWDGASISDEIDGLQLKAPSAVSEEPVLSVDYKDDCPAGAGFRRQIEAAKFMLQNDTQSVLPAGTAPDLYGESIVVITGFKSCAQKGTGIVYHGDEAAQMNGETFAMNNCPFTSASGLPSTSSSKCKPGEKHLRASISAINALDGITQMDEPDLSSENGDLIRGFPGMIKSEAIDLSSRIDKQFRPQELDSNFNDCGATFCQESESRCNSVQESFHREESQRPGNSASALDNGGHVSQGDLSKTPFSRDVMKLRMVTVPQTPTLPAKDGAEFPSKDPAQQSLPGAAKQETLVPTNGNVSAIANDARQVANVSETLEAEGDEGTTEEHLNNGIREEDLLLSSTQAVATRDSFACWCKICGSDFSFCRGCMCSFCREILQPGEDWTVVKCICSHVCHMDCALSANAAGVVKELGLDGELSCPSCSRKVDLWLFFQQRFDLILSLSEVANVNLKGLEKLLLQALQLLEGTEKVKYQFIEGLIIEAYELIRKFPILGLVQNLLRAVRDELHNPYSGPDAETLEGVVGSSATPEEIDWLKHEHLAFESFENAKNERLLMEQAVDKVHKAYADAVNKRKQARSAPRAVMIRERELLKDVVNDPVPEELLISQQAKVDQELKKLWDMRKFEGGNFSTTSALDASASAWIESLKLQRVVVEVAQAKLQHLKKLNRQPMEP